MLPAKKYIPANLSEIKIIADILHILILKLKPRLRQPGKYVSRKENPLLHMLTCDSGHSLQRESYGKL
jgi:hypothetical protein